MQACQRRRFTKLGRLKALADVAHLSAGVYRVRVREGSHRSYRCPGLRPPSEVNLGLRGQEFGEERGVFAHASRHFCSVAGLKIFEEGCINLPYRFSRGAGRKKSNTVLLNFQTQASEGEKVSLVRVH